MQSPKTPAEYVEIINEQETKIYGLKATVEAFKDSDRSLRNKLNQRDKRITELEAELARVTAERDGLKVDLPPSHAFHYDNPTKDDYLKYIDSDIAEICQRINSSGWVWTVESCSGSGSSERPDKNYGHYHGERPFLRLGCWTENAAALNCLIEGLQVNGNIIMYPGYGRVLSRKWFEILVSTDELIDFEILSFEILKSSEGELVVTCKCKNGIRGAGCLDYHPSGKRTRPLTDEEIKELLSKVNINAGISDMKAPYETLRAIQEATLLAAIEKGMNVTFNGNPVSIRRKEKRNNEKNHPQKHRAV